ncbi:MAG: glycosyltransferase family 2 protein [Bacteroidaceae bacterium]|nr:glycosyltransferase family 2 protein [Bacteroidaceae bacterium]
MSAPEVTVVIPVYNREQFLPRLFASLQQIDYEGVNFLLVDNGSADNSLVLCREFAQNDRRVAVLQAPSRGANKARNEGLKACQTEFVYFFDCDDLFSADLFQRVMPLTTGQDMVVFPTKMRRGEHVRQRDFVASPQPEKQILSSSFSTQSVLWRTDFLRTIGGWDPDLRVWQDWELGVRALMNAPRIRFVRESFHEIEVRPDSITGQTNADDRLKAVERVATYLMTQRQRKALDYRRQILLAQYRLPGKGWLYRYVSMGGRGAWRLALLWLRLCSA